MTLEERMDKLTAALERVAVGLEAGGGAAAGKPAAAAGKPAAAKPAAKAKPKTSPDTLKAKFAELKARADIGNGPLKEIITGQGVENLAELLTTPDKYDSAMEALLALEAEKDGGSADADDDEL